MYQRRRIGTILNNLYQILCDRQYQEETVKKIFYKLMGDGIIKENRPGIYFVTDKIEKKISYGKIHSNINERSFGEYDVYDVATGNLMGRIYYVLEKFILGGRCWEKVRVIEKEKKVYAKYVSSAPAITKIFEGKGAGNYNYLLAPVLKKHFFPNLSLEEFPYVFDGRNTHILHLIGSLYSFIIAEALMAEGRDIIEVEGKLLTLNDFKLESNSFPLPGEKTIKRVIGEHNVQLEDALGSGAYLYDLPFEYQMEDHYRNLDISGLIEFLSSIKLVEMDSKRFQEVVKFIGS